MLRLKIRLALLAATFGLAASSVPAQAAPGKKQQKSEEAYLTPLSREIHHQLLLLPFYSVFDNLNFSVKGSMVTLSGQVVRPTLKAHAEAAVKSIEGVGGVVNQIEILPFSPADDDLRNTVYRAIFEDPALARYAVASLPPIHIIIKNGNVTLEGSVASAGDKNLAAARAGGVANVLSVKNNLLVQANGSAGE